MKTIYEKTMLKSTVIKNKGYNLFEMWEDIYDNITKFNGI